MSAVVSAMTPPDSSVTVRSPDLTRGWSESTKGPICTGHEGEDSDVLYAVMRMLQGRMLQGDLCILGCKALPNAPKHDAQAQLKTETYRGRNKKMGEGGSGDEERGNSRG